ncbi:MAG: type II secretion system F family protein [Lapillicoccus sp.]
MIASWALILAPSGAVASFLAPSGLVPSGLGPTLAVGARPVADLLVPAAVMVGLAVLVWPPRARGPGRVARGLLRPDAVGGREHEALTVDDVAGAMVLLAVALRSGCGVIEAIEAVARVSDGAPAADLATVAAAHRWGIDDYSAWAAVDPAWARTEQALRLAARSGVAPSTLLLEGASDLRGHELAALDIAAARVGVRMVLPLGLVFLPAFCLTSVVPLVVALAARVLSE